MSRIGRAGFSGLLVCFLSACAGVGSVSDGPAFDPSLEQSVMNPGWYEAGPTGSGVHAGSGASYEFMGFNELDGWRDDDHAAALEAFLVSCTSIERRKESADLGGLIGQVRDWREVCETAQSLKPTEARAFFEGMFTPVRIEPSEQGLVTAYFEPELEASREPRGAFQHPIYRKPDEVVRVNGEYGRRGSNGGVRPYFTRAEIDEGALEGRGLEIAYLEDAVDNFFLHIQGSGRLRWVDGGMVRVGYAAKNGWPYQSVGKAMLRQGLARNGDASAGAIQQFYRDDPERGQALLSENPSYIFFREVESLDPDGGPVGAFGVQLVAKRSVAVDRAYTPLGAPVWLETDSPTGPIRSLMVAHDTGSAIKGPQRVDYFWGSGDEAGRLAGQMKHRGTLTMLMPKRLAWRLSGGVS